MVVVSRNYVKDGTLAVQHIRTGDNVADFFTKALQGAESFDKFRTFLMGSQDFGAYSKRE